MRPRPLLSYPCAALLWLSSARAEPANTLEPARVYDWLRHQFADDDDERDGAADRDEYRVSEAMVRASA